MNNTEKNELEIKLYLELGHTCFSKIPTAEYFFPNRLIEGTRNSLKQRITNLRDVLHMAEAVSKYLEGLKF